MKGAGIYGRAFGGWLTALALTPWLLFAADKASSDFSGTWHWAKGKEELTLYLRQTDQKLSGWHAAIGQGGDKVDEVVKTDEQSITGEVAGNIAKATFRSGYPESKGGGKAELTLQGNTIRWRVIESSGEHYLPQTAKLSRVVTKEK